MLGAVDDGTPLPKPVEPEVRVDEPATDDVAEAFSWCRRSVDKTDGGEGGCSALMRLATSCRVSVRKEADFEFSFASTSSFGSELAIEYFLWPVT